MQRYLTVEVAAKYLGISERALYMRIHRGTIEHIKWRRSVRFDIRKLDAMMDAGAQGVPAMLSKSRKETAFR